jgi:hypothetical protein
MDEKPTLVIDPLRVAVGELYYSAVWHADRPVDEEALWKAVRDAAGLPHGESPKELPYSGMRVDFSLGKLRQIAITARKSRGGEFSTEHMGAFLSLYREDIEERVNKAVREFLEEKLG